MNLKALISVLICVAGTCIASDTSVATQPAGQPDSQTPPSTDNDQTKGTAQAQPAADNNDASKGLAAQAQKIIADSANKYNPETAGGKLTAAIADAVTLLNKARIDGLDCYNIIQKLQNLNSRIVGFSKNDDLDKLIQGMNQIALTLQGQIRELSVKADGYEQERARQLHILEELQKKVSDLQANLQETQLKYSSELSKTHTLENSLQTIQAQIDRMNKEKEDLIQKANDTEQKIGINKGIVSGQEQSLKDLQGSLGSVEQDINKKNQLIAKLKEDQNKLQRQVDDTRPKIGAAESEKSRLQAELLKLMQEEANYVGIIESLRLVITGNNSNSLTIQAKLSEVKSSIAETRRRLDTLKNESNKKAREKEALENSAKEINEKIAKAQTELKEKTDEEVLLNKAISDLDANITSQKDSLNKSTEALGALDAQIKSQEVKISELNRNSRDKTDQYKKSDRELQALNHKVEDSEKKTANLDRTLKQLTKQIADYVKKATERGLGTAYKAKNHLGELKVRLNKIKQETETELTSLDNNVTTLDAKIASLTEAQNKSIEATKNLS